MTKHPAPLKDLLVTWEVCELDTWRVVDTFRALLSKPDAIATACARGYPPSGYLVRAALDASAYRPKRPAKDYAAIARAKRRRA